MSMSFRPAALLAAGALALGGCVETAGGLQPENNAEAGAIAGAVIGGVIGATRPGRNRLAKAAVGAGIGAAVGGVIGQMLDKHAQDIRDRMGDRVQVVNTGSELVVTMPNDILFDSGSDYVRADLRHDLAELAASLNDYPDTTIDVIGHTDNTGPASLNQELSARRARAVADELILNGVAPDRIRAFGRGEDEPVATNLTEEGKAQNRRVEIIIRPNT